MTEFPDARHQFYLEHQDIIDTWAQLQVETRKALSQCLVDLQVDVAKMAKRLEAESTLFESPQWAGHRLSHSAWNDNQSENPSIVVYLDWDPLRVKLPDRPPNVGVMIQGSGEDAGALRAEFRARLDESDKALRGYDLRPPTEWALARCKLPPPPGSRWWDPLDDYREFLLDGLETAWNDLSTRVDQWLVSRQASP